MSHWSRWTRLIVATSLLPLFGGACSVDFRDALYGGVLDFVSGTTTEVLTNLIPLAQGIPGA